METRLIDRLLIEYGESHQNHTNKLIHWICVPLIMFSLFGILMSIPFPGRTTLYLNWASILLGVALLYYLRLSVVMMISFAIIGSVFLLGNYSIFQGLIFNHFHLLLVSVSIFAAAWIGQFIGHHIEGKKPSFLKDLQFLLIGPAWLLSFIYKKIGLNY